MSLLRWIWAYLFDCVHSHTTWPHQNQFGLAYVCCLDCGREMRYSLEFMQIVKQDRKRNIWDSRLPAPVPLIIACALLFLTPSYAVAQLQPTRRFLVTSAGYRCACTRRSFATPPLSHHALLSVPARVARPGLQPFTTLEGRRLYEREMSGISKYRQSRPYPLNGVTLPLAHRSSFC
jgi:hypothetical protein